MSLILFLLVKGAVIIYATFLLLTTINICTQEHKVCHFTLPVGEGCSNNISTFLLLTTINICTQELKVCHFTLPVGEGCSNNLCNLLPLRTINICTQELKVSRHTTLHGLVLHTQYIIMLGIVRNSYTNLVPTHALLCSYKKKVSQFRLPLHARAKNPAQVSEKAL